MMPSEGHLRFERAPFLIDTDPGKLDIDMVQAYLSQESYWAEGRSMELVRKSIENSLNFGLYEGKKQIGFARLVTDLATFAWLADVFILPEYRGRGLAKWMLECILSVDGMQDMKRVLLGTRDAHDLYQQFGFQALKKPATFMERRKDALNS